MKIQQTLKYLLLVFSCLGMLSFFVQAQSLATTTQTSAESLLRAIEIQGKTQETLLRLLIDVVKQSSIISQTNSANFYRLLIITESLRNQQAKVENIMAEIEQLNLQVNQLPDTKIYDNQLRDLESIISITVDPVQRNTLVESYNSLKRSVEYDKEQNQKSAEASRIRLQQLQVRLEDEKAKLDDLDNRASIIDRHFQSISTPSSQKTVK